MARHRAVTLQNVDPHGIDAKGRRQAVAQMHVGGGKAHGAAARIAMLDPRLHRPGMAQQARRFFGAWPSFSVARIRVEEIFSSPAAVTVSKAVTLKPSISPI